MIFELSRDILSSRFRWGQPKGLDDKNKRDIFSAVEIEDSLPVLSKLSKRRSGHSFLQLDNSHPHSDDIIPAPKYDSHNQPIPPNLQLKRFNSSHRYSSHQHQLVQDLSVKLISIVVPKPSPPPPRPESRKIPDQYYIRVRKLREDKCDLSFCLPKPFLRPRQPSPLRQELARG